MLIYGKQVAADTRAKLKDDVKSFEEKYGRKPSLAVIIVGEDPASQTYVKNKIKGCEEVGMRSLHYEYADGTPQSEIEKTVKELADDETVDGILVQLPLPKGYDEKSILGLIPDEKDVDGFSPTNLGLLAMNRPGTISCTPFGVMKMLETTGVDLAGKNAVVIGRSNTVGKPMAMLLLHESGTVTVCHSKTVDLKEECKRADILVAAVGVPKLIKGDMIKEGAVVIDVGMNRLPDGKLCGDVDFEQASEKASYITPVPGGVGPMTIAMLMKNTLTAAKNMAAKGK